ncbi:tetratricopeptide repeat protein [Dongia sp.]|uniref:tetratricopeptide repeat protein n=1 Tax=Dongia sp. TaxID=1977262 RepID=UPI0035AE8E7A
MLDYITMRRHLNRVLCCTGLLLGLGSAVAAADQKDPRLPALFQRLHDADNAQIARLTEFMIWQIWSESGTPELDRMMEEGEAAMETQDYAAAIGIFSEIVAARPDFAEGWNRRATVYYLSGDYNASLADIEKVLELEPRHFGAISGLGVVNLARAHDEAARDAFERVLSLYPRNAPARENLKLVKKRLDDSAI